VKLASAAADHFLNVNLVGGFYIRTAAAMAGGKALQKKVPPAGSFS
jgi:hypothetical protein